MWANGSSNSFMRRMVTSSYDQVSMPTVMVSSKLSVLAFLFALKMSLVDVPAPLMGCPLPGARRCDRRELSQS